MGEHAHSSETIVNVVSRHMGKLTASERKQVDAVMRERGGMGAEEFARQRFAELSGVGGALRPGIVHRLDRFTSGVLLVAKNDAAHRGLAEQFSGRQVSKTYLALVEGEVKPESGRIARPIARDPVHRTRMTARLAEGRAAWSEYRVLRRFTGFTLLEVRIGTGRTHQIRVHLASIKHPVVGDTLYGAKARPELGRYFLHAHRIEFRQPSTGEAIMVVSPLAPELEVWLLNIASVP